MQRKDLQPKFYTGRRKPSGNPLMMGMSLLKKILILDIKASGIEYILYSVIPSPLYLFTGKLFVRSSLFKVIKKGSIGHSDLPSLLEEINRKDKIDHIIAGLPFYKFAHHIIELPLQKEKEIKTAMPFELEKRLPLPPEEYLYDFTILKKDKKNSEILTLSIKKQHLLNIIEPLRTFPVSEITCTFILIVSAFARHNKGRAVIIREDGDFIYLACLTDSRIKALGLFKNYEDIEYPLGFEDPAVARYIIGPAIGHPLRIEKENLHTYLKGYRRIDINFFNTLRTLSTRSKGNKLLSFLPEGFSIPVKDPRFTVASTLLITSVTLFLLTDMVLYYKENKALNLLARKTEILKKDTPIKKPEEEEKTLLHKYINMRARITEIFSILSKALPHDAEITALGIDIQQATVEIEGMASRSSSILERLESTGYFKNITYSGAITVKEGKEIFKFKMEIK